MRFAWLTAGADPDQSLPKPWFHTDPGHPGFDPDVFEPMPEHGVDSGTVFSPSRRGPLYDLVHIMDRLLGPGGCLWDQAQTHASLRACLIEEAYEVVEAIDRKDLDSLKEELGDLLLQPVMHAQIEKKSGGWDTDAVATAIVGKLVRRHPHVFGEAAAEDAEAVLKNWDAIKRAERGDNPKSILDGVPSAMPALLRALEVSKRAARAGFEWPDLDAVWDKHREEIEELREALAVGNRVHIESEFGDLLFTVVNLARWCKVDPEQALRSMLARFVERFRIMEEIAELELAELDPPAWDALWQRAKYRLAEPTEP